MSVPHPGFPPGELPVPAEEPDHAPGNAPLPATAPRPLRDGGMDLFPELDTPALLIDLDRLERNLETMQRELAVTACTLRPHFKSHRIGEIARMQAARGAGGFTCAKLAEAEALARLGLDDFLIANQVVGPHKWRRLAALAANNRVTVGVDDPAVAAETARAAHEHGAVVGVLVEVDTGMHRCGVPPGDPAVALARHCARLPGLELRGVMGYEGHTVHLPPGRKEAECRAAVELLVGTAEAIRAAGLSCPIVSAGGTGSWYITSRLPGVTELQCGSYALMDLLFHQASGGVFEFACTVLATVISHPAPGRVVLDTGKKALHPDFGPPRVLDRPELTVTSLNSEHALLQASPAGSAPRVGERLRLVPGYVEGTTNLHAAAWAVRGDKVIAEWPVTGRDCSR